MLAVLDRVLALYLERILVLLDDIDEPGVVFDCGRGDDPGSNLFGRR